MERISRLNLGQPQLPPKDDSRPLLALEQYGKRKHAQRDGPPGLFHADHRDCDQMCGLRRNIGALSGFCALIA